MADGLSIESLEQLLQLLELENVRFVHYSVERHSAKPEVKGNEPKIGVSPQLGDSGDDLTVTVGMEFEGEHLDINVAIQAQYRFSEPVLEIERDVMGQFLGRSTMLTVVPYFREAMHSAGARFGLPVPLLNLARPQELQPAAEGPDEEAE